MLSSYCRTHTESSYEALPAIRSSDRQAHGTGEVLKSQTMHSCTTIIVCSGQTAYEAASIVAMTMAVPMRNLQRPGNTLGALHDGGC